MGVLRFEGNQSFFDRHASRADLGSLLPARLKAGKVKLKGVDKMLFSTDSPTNPMVINTLLIMKGSVGMEDMKVFLGELAMAHPRLRMRIEGGCWKPTEVSLGKEGAGWVGACHLGRELK